MVASATRLIALYVVIFAVQPPARAQPAIRRRDVMFGGGTPLWHLAKRDYRPREVTYNTPVSRETMRPLLQPGMREKGSDLPPAGAGVEQTVELLGASRAALWEFLASPAFKGAYWEEWPVLIKTQALVSPEPFLTPAAVLPHPHPRSIRAPLLAF
jgi:hypothetical protein